MFYVSVVNPREIGEGRSTHVVYEVQFKVFSKLLNQIRRMAQDSSMLRAVSRIFLVSMRF